MTEILQIIKLWRCAVLISCIEIGIYEISLLKY